MKKKLMVTLVSVILMCNFALLINNTSLAQEPPSNEIGDVNIICDQPPPVQGRCTKHDIPGAPENCIWDGRTIMYCMPW